MVVRPDKACVAVLEALGEGLLRGEPVADKEDLAGQGARITCGEIVGIGKISEHEAATVEVQEAGSSGRDTLWLVERDIDHGAGGGDPVAAPRHALPCAVEGHVDCAQGVRYSQDLGREPEAAGAEAFEGGQIRVQLLLFCHGVDLSELR